MPDRLQLVYNNTMKNISRQFQATYIIAGTMIVGGLSIILGPSQAGATSIIDDIYHMSVALFGCLTLIGGFATLVAKLKPAYFLIATFPFIMYIVAGGAYLLSHPGANPVGLIYFVGYYLLMVRQYITYYETENARPNN